MEPRELINARPGWLAKVQAEGTEAEVWTTDGHTHTYTVVGAAGLPAELTWGIGHPEGDHDHYYISDNVPEDFRRDWITHEVREETSMAHLPRRERCPAAMQAELAEVRRRTQMTGRFGRYIATRLQMFEELISFFETGAGAPTNKGQDEEFKAGLRASHALLDDEMFTILTE